eukprot:2101310-Amphidinium_carterae.1
MGTTSLSATSKAVKTRSLPPSAVSLDGRPGFPTRGPQTGNTQYRECVPNPAQCKGSKAHPPPFVGSVAQGLRPVYGPDNPKLATSQHGTMALNKRGPMLVEEFMSLGTQIWQLSKHTQ